MRWRANLLRHRNRRVVGLDAIDRNDDALSEVLGDTAELRAIAA